MRPEAITTLKALNNKNPSVLAMEKKTIRALADRQDLQSFIDELRDEIKLTKDSDDHRVPFYNFHLAVLLLKENKFDEAKDKLFDASHGFHLLDWMVNEAMSEWLFSTIHFENEDYERAKRACYAAINILKSAIRQNESESNYEAARELFVYLAQLYIFQDNIDTAADSDTILKDYHSKLKNDIEYLKRQKKKIRPIFIANEYYLSKILLMPAHYVSRMPYEPATDRERNMHEVLRDKVGFFQIIERLVDLERELDPGATWEELLHRINQEWDKDVNG